MSEQRAPTEWVGSGDPPGAGRDGSTGSGGGRRRGIIIGAVVAVLVLVGGGAALAFQVLSGGGPQPDEAIPSSALGYVRIDLDPAADQKVNAVRLLRRVPEFEKETGITSDTDDLRKRLFEFAIAENEGCEDIDYDADIAPWVGDRAGAAVIPATDGNEPDALAVLQVTDEDAARDGLEALNECSTDAETETPGLAFVGDYALLAETQELADRFAADAEEQPLSEDADYTADMEALDGEGIASAWVDIDATLDLLADSAGEQLSPETVALSGLSEMDSVAMSVGATSDSLEMEVAADGVAAGFGDPAEQIQALPETTLFAVGVSGGTDAIEAGWQQMTEYLEQEQPGTVEQFTSELEAATGLRLPDDLQTLVGDDFALAFDEQGLEIDEATGEPTWSTIPLGLRTTSDIAAVTDLVDRVDAVLAQYLPVSLVETETDSGGSAISLSQEYADRLAADGGLGQSDTYQAAVADAENAAAVYYLDFDRTLTLADQLGEQAGEPLPDDDRTSLEVLRAFGLSASVDGDYTKATVRLVFD